MDAITLYRWRARDERTGRWRTLRYLATEADMRARFPAGAYEKIDGSQEVRRIPLREHLLAGHVLRGWGRNVKSLCHSEPRSAFDALTECVTPQGRDARDAV